MNRRNSTKLMVRASLPLWLVAVGPVLGQEEFTAPLPAGVRPVWEVSKAYRETTATREQICLNGLWRWQPAEPSTAQVPTQHWGYFKVPGCWPGITDYMQKDSQTLHAHAGWKNERLGNIGAAWYERTITVPANWSTRRIGLSAAYLNSFAAVFVDGTKCGELRFPGGELELTTHLRPGSTHVLSLLVVALPLKGVLLSYTDSNAARETKGKVERRGLCGDVFLTSTPSGPRITNVKVEPSLRKGQLALSVALQGLAVDGRYSLRAQISKGGEIVREFTSQTFTADELHNGRSTLTSQWTPEALWDLHTPQNQYEVACSLFDASGQVLDTHYRVPFGYREFWIQGRDFYLNGSRLFLCAVPLDNAQVGAALATYAAARESLARLKSIGINLVYTHNYGCEPGAHLSFEEILRAADDVGMLVSLSQPHFSHYQWRTPEAEQTNGYAQHAEFYVRLAQNHPSVVAYAMSHNATGYEEDMNPELIDGVREPRDTWSRNNAQLALRAEALVRRLDPGRIIYHHASGNLGSMHPINFYPNFAPIQELSDWFEHWAQDGVKPVFTCEYGAPFTWDWTMYRGWYKGQREFGSAQVPWEFCVAEWNAQFLGDRAFAISRPEAANLRWEAKQWRAGKVWHRWDYPYPVGSPAFDEQYPIFAMYLTANWRAFRTWGVSAISPWEYGHYWKRREDAPKRRQQLPVDWENLQRPGFSPDYIDQQYERMDLALERSDWVPTAAARALLRHNAPLLAYLGGKAEHFTSQEHVFFPGETLEKQLIVINNSRQTVRGEAMWSLALPKRVAGHKEFSVATGQQERVPLSLALPESLAPGQYELSATVRFSNGETQTDSFSVHILPRPPNPTNLTRPGELALFDPKGETATLLTRMGLRYRPVDASTDLAGIDTLLIGKSALALEAAAPDITRVRRGLKVLMFEQTADVLEKRFGFRVAEYGLRQVFSRVPEHPALVGLTAQHWQDWRGSATLLAPRLEYSLRPRYGPTVNWCDIPVPRLWRCGNRGNVASVLIEKPARGDFLPLLDGGYGLQYSTLLEYREGQGMILFCQMDVTGRTESEPAAETLTRNILRYVADWEPRPVRTAVYVGDAEGQRHLEAAGFQVSHYEGQKMSPEQLLVVGPGGGRALTANKSLLTEWLNSGGHILALGLGQEDVDALSPTPVKLSRAEHISTFFEPARMNSFLQGIGPAELHNRDPRELLLITSGATPIGNGVMAMSTSKEPGIVFCQLVPWQFEPDKQLNLKRTYRRASFVVTRLMSNFGVASTTPILNRFNTPLDATKPEKRWLSGFYLEQPEEWDDPYRFFRW